MIITKVINDDEGQIISFPPQIRLSGDEVYIQTLGEGILLLDKNKVDEMLADSIRDIAEGRTFSQEEVDAHMEERFATFKSKHRGGSRSQAAGGSAPSEASDRGRP